MLFEIDLQLQVRCAPIHRRSQGWARDHDPQTFSISCHFVLWEAMSQIKDCCSLEVKIWPPQLRHWSDFCRNRLNCEASPSSWPSRRVRRWARRRSQSSKNNFWPVVFQFQWHTFTLFCCRWVLPIKHRYAKCVSATLWRARKRSFVRKSIVEHWAVRLSVQIQYHWYEAIITTATTFASHLRQFDSNTSI